jgi:hypothetical protein
MRATHDKIPVAGNEVYVIFMGLELLPMDFLFCRALFYLPGQRTAPALGGGRGSYMRHNHIAEDLAQSRSRNATTSDRERSELTPAEFFKDAGMVIALCLGLGLLMQLVLG